MPSSLSLLRRIATLALVCVRVGAEEIALMPAADTSLLAVVPTHNLGASSTLAVGGVAKALPARALLRFDFAGVPFPAASLSGARLDVTVTRVPGGAVPSVFGLHRVLTSWEEGTGGRLADAGDSGREGLPGESTWAARSHPDAMWMAPGGAQGLDWVASASGTVAVTGLGTYSIATPGMLDDVRQWLADPGANFGWILVSDEEDVALTARRLGSREDPGRAPVLRLVFDPVRPPEILRWGRDDDRFLLEFRGEAGNIYEVQVRSGFDAASPWEVLSQHIVKLVSTNVVVTDPIEGRVARFYRVADVGDVD